MLYSVHFAMSGSFFKDKLRTFCCEELRLPVDAWSTCEVVEVASSSVLLSEGTSC